MSLYNMLFGQNPLTPILKEVLIIDKNKMPEYSDVLSWKDDKGNRYFDYDPVYDEKDGAKEAWDKLLKKCLEVEYYPSGRFRDIYYDKYESKIVLYTRNGGGNRKSYKYVFDILQKHPNYLRDYDDDYDSTYAYIEFSVPDKFKKMLNDLVTESKGE